MARFRSSSLRERRVTVATWDRETGTSVPSVTRRPLLWQARGQVWPQPDERPISTVKTRSQQNEGSVGLPSSANVYRSVKSLVRRPQRIRFSRRAEEVANIAQTTATEALAGLVERVTFHNSENDFCVLRVKARIKALAEKTVSNGCTEAEAMAAAEMVGRLLERYALSMEEIDVREQRCVQVEVPIGGKQCAALVFAVHREAFKSPSEGRRSGSCRQPV